MHFSLDVINGLYEGVGSLMVWVNVLRIRKDKELKGASILPVVFFTSWSVFNAFYYPSLNQWISFVGGLSLGIANGVWLLHALHYRKVNEKVPS